MNILCIGNSFSVDIATYVHQIAKASGHDINIYVLYIGGCPIDLHYKNFLSGEKAYNFYENGQEIAWFSILEGLQYKKYDYITFQQRSYDSGDAKTFFPELTKLMEGVRKYSDATFILHKTWSYAKNYTHDKYGSNPLDQEAMTKDIENAYEEVSKISGIKYIIPSGTAITEARKVFGDNLNRDGFHLNERARTLTGILWVYYLSNAKELDLSTFSPSGYTYDEVTPPVSKEEINKLNKIAKETIKLNKGHNLYE